MERSYRNNVVNQLLQHMHGLAYEATTGRRLNYGKKSPLTVLGHAALDTVQALNFRDSVWLTHQPLL